MLEGQALLVVSDLEILVIILGIFTMIMVQTCYLMLIIVKDFASTVMVISGWELSCLLYTSPSPRD